MSHERSTSGAARISPSGARRAALWDMDGVLVDSADYHYAAWREALAREGYDLRLDEFRATFGQRNDTILRRIFGADLPDAEVARIATVKEALYRRFVQERGIAPLPGVLRWLKALHEAGWRQAVASAAPRANVDVVLEALGIGRFFDAITSAEDVTRGKPDPQVYLVSAERVGVPPRCCVVIEDAPAGLEGARRAGMRCIGVTSTHDHLDADVVVASLDALDDDAFDRLIARCA
ncbi:MAG: HAD family phosphatase [Anaerolineae bacterium]|nr:HAD family phosphatase [Anaerolineae bacterium]